MKIEDKIVAAAQEIGGPDEWRPVARIGMFTPVQMRKRGSDGGWIYREPTEAEITDFLSSEAW